MRNSSRLIAVVEQSERRIYRSQSSSRNETTNNKLTNRWRRNGTKNGWRKRSSSRDRNERIARNLLSNRTVANSMNVAEKSLRVIWTYPSDESMSNKEQEPRGVVRRSSTWFSSEEREMNRLIRFIWMNFEDQWEKSSVVDEACSMVRLAKKWREAMAFNSFTWGFDKKFFSAPLIHLPRRDRFNAINRPSHWWEIESYSRNHSMILRVGVGVGVWGWVWVWVWRRGIHPHTHTPPPTPTPTPTLRIVNRTMIKLISLCVHPWITRWFLFNVCLVPRRDMSPFVPKTKTNSNWFMLQ